MKARNLWIEYRAATTAAVVATLVAAGVASGVGRGGEVRLAQPTAATEEAPAVQSTTSTTLAPTTTTTTQPLTVPQRVDKLEQRVAVIESTPTTSAPVYAPPPLPERLPAPQVTATGWDLTWLPVEGAATYRVDVPTYAPTVDVPCCAATVADPGVTAAVLVTVQAIGADGTPGVLAEVRLAPSPRAMPTTTTTTGGAAS